MRRYAAGIALALLALLPAALLAPGIPDRPDSPVAATGSQAVRLAADAGAPTESAEPAEPVVRTVTLALTGDVLIHDNVWASARRAAGGRGFDFRPMLASLRPTLSEADLALCHLETPLAPPGGPYAGYPLFSAPPQIVPALRWVGYDGCSTASNHSVDQGFSGVTRSLQALDAAGLRHTGSARTAAESRAITGFHVHGIEIAWLSYTYGTNGMPVDADKPWSVNLIDVRRILADARRARAAGADAVVVALHWGDEYSHSPSAFQRDVADRLTHSGDISLLYGHHAHVVQPITRVNGTWVVYGLGNLLAGQGTTASGVANGMIALATLRQRGDGTVRVSRPTYRPTHIDYTDPHGEFRVYDVRRALSLDVDATTRAELRASAAQTHAVLNP
jgi:poly-gamma-glutamate synthesis protein (capsule biosynthesis protein)